MIVYITPDKVEGFSKKIYGMTKHLENPPKVEFSEPKLMKRQTITIRNNGWGIDGQGTGGYSRTVDIINVVEVTIDDITAGDWVLVASVFYKERLVTMVSPKYYKIMPERFGLDYVKCDYCGKSHQGRNDSHILYNEKTGEWMQVGSSCVTKMFDTGKYMASFTVQLNKIVEIFNGCCDPDMAGLNRWVANQPDHSFERALRVEALVPVVVEYRKDNPNWVKTYYFAGEKCPGTTHLLTDYFDKHPEIKENKEFQKGLVEYVNSLPDNEFNNQIKEAFEDGLVQRYNVYKVFFAVKMYQEFLTQGDWENAKAKYPIGTVVEFRNVDIPKWDMFEGFYGPTWEAVFKYEGLQFGKGVSSLAGFQSKFQNPDGTYTFKQTVGTINDRTRVLILKGRASKIS